MNFLNKLKNKAKGVFNKISNNLKQESNLSSRISDSIKQQVQKVKEKIVNVSRPARQTIENQKPIIKGTSTHTQPQQSKLNTSKVKTEVIPVPVVPPTSSIDEEEEKRFKELQEKRNQAVEEFKSTITDQNVLNMYSEYGLLNQEHIPYSLLNSHERSELMDEYKAIINDAQSALQHEMTRGITAFDYLLDETILVDVDQDLKDKVKEAFNKLHGKEKDKLLSELFEYAREYYKDVHIGTETKFGIENAEEIANRLVDLANGKAIVWPGAIQN